MEDKVMCLLEKLYIEMLSMKSELRSEMQEMKSELRSEMHSMHSQLCFEMDEMKQVMATKEDLKGMASKEDIKNMATKEDLKGMATKEDIKNMATKEDLKGMATKEDIIKLNNNLFIMENQLKNEIAIVYDGYKQCVEGISNINYKIDRLTEKVDNQEIRLQVLKTAK
ncbi:hypothetical protein F8154_13155 [Alkaliphilus pronyensis]|uniref:DUF5082 domain-containing protein n=1 Tax=Alkaliphilus pronyensis TaxID=1482732 RepID=A0A6I0F6G7_9FIRM|nr:hypothetical protein [Alkaliphilus pronyensis]KAB3531170.1 hypothetical protein F8154_13155 [Alkaliphilus pronyensis]